MSLSGSGEGSLRSPAYAAAKAGVAANMTSYLSSSEFPGVWPSETPDGEKYDKKKTARAIAVALADLGPGAKEDNRDKAVKQASVKVLGSLLQWSVRVTHRTGAAALMRRKVCW